MNKKIILATSLLFSMSAFSLASVYDAGDGMAISQTNQSADLISGGTQSLAVLQQSLNNINQMDFPGKIQALETEIQQLQGQVDELQHKVKSLEGQQKTQYQDLDSRLQQNSSPVPMVTDSSASSTALAAPSADLSPAEQDKQTYLAAYSLVTEKQYDNAISAFQAYLSIYQDQGKYSANAHYWLGELYVVKKDYDNAAEQLNDVVTQFPESSKTADALYKLGTIASAQGDSDKAKQYFEKVVQNYPNSSSAKFAQAKL